MSNLYGNPHSASSPSALAGHRIDTIREKALIKLVIECFKDHAAASNTPVWYGYHRDAHTSLVGVRELTKMHRCFTSDEEVDIWINSGGMGGPRARQLGLFAYPGQSNMTGRRLPLSWYVVFACPIHLPAFCADKVQAWSYPKTITQSRHVHASGRRSLGQYLPIGSQ